MANGFGTPYAAFAGYTPSLVGYVSVFNPISPTVHDTMGGSASCYRLEFGGLDCPGEMFGANAPASTWHMTFDHANLGPVTYFVPVPADSPFNSMGNGQVVVQPKKGKGGGGGGGGRRRRRRRARRRRWRRRARRRAVMAAAGTASRSSEWLRGSAARGQAVAASSLADDRPGRRPVGPATGLTGG